MAQAWVVTITGTEADGNLTQLYPENCTAESNPATANGANGDKIRFPSSGNIISLSIKSDGTNAGRVELFDINGLDAGADVSSSNQITNEQYIAEKAQGVASLIYNQSFAASPGSVIPGDVRKDFLRGLAGRYVGTGTVTLNITVIGGYGKYDASHI